LTITFEACALLEELAPSQRNQGHFLSALILAEAARRDERRRLQQAGQVVAEAGAMAAPGGDGEAV
jgi:hypothetical protein